MTQAPLFLIVEGNAAVHDAVKADYGAQTYARAYGQVLAEVRPVVRWVSLLSVDGLPRLRHLAWAFGLDSDILDPVTHRSEICAWMDHLVIPYRRERGRD
ncbi:hypothetical protein [Rhodospirillum sp. A1_3_36]|uniref:hypothetical protein n=1 Tax=Rhodospirillum sp. A1_3_36 TaxID=3391666 RepID=UPI0039A651D1